MTSYTKSTNFATKDTLTSGDPLKIVKGTEINTEFDNIATAVNSKSDTASPTFTGTVTIPTASVSSTTDSSSTSTGSIVTAGGVGVAKNLYVGVNANVAGTLGVTGVSTFAAGTALLPAITTTGDTNTGIFFPAADTIAFSEGGVESMRIDSSGNVGIGVTPSAWDTTYRILQIGGNPILSGTDQALGLTSNAYYNSGWKYVTSGRNAALYEINKANGGIHAWHNAPSGTAGNAITFTQAMTLDASGNLLVGDTAVGAGAERFLVKSAGTSGATAGVRVINSAGTELLFIRSDGAFRTGSAATSPYNNTLAASANCYINTDGTLLRATSSLKYKRDVQDATFGLSDVLNLRAVTYKGKNEADGENIYGGLIAEEVHASGLTQFVQYAEDGSPDALHYGNMVSLCIKAIQQQQAIITSLTDRITALETP